MSGIFVEYSESLSSNRAIIPFCLHTALGIDLVADHIVYKYVRYHYIMAYCTQYMSAYRSPHESPTGNEGATSRVVTLKMENNKLRQKNKDMAEELIRLRQQLSYIRVAAKPKYTHHTKRPAPIDLSGILPYQPYERRPGLSRVASAPSVVSSGRVSAAVGEPSESSSLVSTSENIEER